MDEEGERVNFSLCLASFIDGLISCRQVDIFKKDVVVIPVNLGNAHWTCAAINMRLKRIEYYDSMGSRRERVFLVRYLAL